MNNLLNLCTVENMNTTGQRIRALREKRGFSQQGIADALGVTRGAVGNWELDKGLKLESLKALAKLLDTSIEWLDEGIAPSPFDDDAPEPLVSVLGSSKAKEHIQRAGEVREIDVVAGMGQGSYAQEIIVDGQSRDNPLTSWVFPTSLLHTELRVSEQHLDIIRVEGDSMQPTLLPGDRVMVNRQHQRPSPDAIYAIDNGLGIVVKRLELVLGSEPPQVRIKSDNPAHSDQTMLADDIRIIGRVVLKISKM